MQASEPDEILYFDFCHMCRGKNDLTYVLILKEDLQDTFAYNRIKTLIPAAQPMRKQNEKYKKECSAFGVVNKWVSDQGVYLNNVVIRGIVRSTQIFSSIHVGL